MEVVDIGEDISLEEDDLCEEEISNLEFSTDCGGYIQEVDGGLKEEDGETSGNDSSVRDGDIQAINGGLYDTEEGDSGGFK